MNRLLVCDRTRVGAWGASVYGLATSRRVPQALVCALPAIVLAVCVLIPWIGKAYTIDDTLFLRQAEHALRDPLHPSAFDYQWSGGSVRRLSQYMPSGPVMPYLLIPSVLVRNGEWVGHTIELLFLVVATVALASIALRLGYGKGVARLAALVLVASPAVLAMTATCMPDTVAMSLGAVGIDRTLAWRDNRRWRSATAAAVALALSVAARSHFAMLLVPGFVFAVSDGADRHCPSLRRRITGALPVLAAALLAWVCLRVTRDPATGGDVISSVVSLAGTDWHNNLFAFLVHHTLALPLGLGMFLVRLRAGWPDPLLVVALPAVLAFARARRDLFLAVAAALALAGLLRALIAESSPSRKPGAALVLWLLAPLPVIFYIHFPSKYLLLSAPAAALLLAAALQRRGAIARRVLACSLIVMGTTLGLLVVRADSRLSGLGRQAARTIVVPAVQSGVTVWFSGHWGFQWYMEQGGARPLLQGTRPAPGNLIVMSSSASGRLARGCDRDLLNVLSEAAPGGRIMAGGAGFYSNGWGYYPWVWSARADERIEVWRVRGGECVFVNYLAAW